MRGVPKRERSPATVDLRSFGWDRIRIATLQHSTLPWFEELAATRAMDATPLSARGDLGARDRLSLVAQFAAHEALLQFAGVSGDGCHLDEWAVVRKRGSDCRLVRVSASRGAVDASGIPINAIQDFAEQIGSPKLDVFRHSWTRAEAVYREVAERLRADAAADLRWMVAAAVGEISSPGPELLREILAATAGHWTVDDASCFRAIEKAAALGTERVVALGAQASPVHRFSALAEISVVIGPLAGLSEAAVVEKAVEAAARERLIFLRSAVDRCDSASMKVLEMLAASDAGRWITLAENSDLPPARYFLVSPSLASRRELELRIGSIPAHSRADWVHRFAVSAGYESYLTRGELPGAVSDSRWESVREPAKSFLAALALLGPAVAVAHAVEFLKKLGFAGPIEELVIEGVTSMEEGAVRFATPAAAESARAHIPSASRASLCAIAAAIAEEQGDRSLAASLLIQAGDWANAVRLVESVECQSAEATVRLLRDIPRQSLSQSLAARLTDAFLDLGQYLDAREAAHGLNGDAREIAFAESERRTGEYRLALSRLGRLETPTARAELLRAELLLLENRSDEAGTVLEGVRPSCSEEAIRCAYLQAVREHRSRPEDRDRQAVPRDHYLGWRLETYRALNAGELDVATSSAQQSLERARTVPEKVDAALDHLYILFSSGAWRAARDESLNMLALVEETQGDRAAGGVLFLLAYLAADDGQWAHASQRIHRLRVFYQGADDNLRLAEIDLLAAHLDFSRGNFAAAARSAEAIVREGVGSQIGEAAALILDDIDWIEGRSTPLRSTGKSGNVELTDRHRALCVRRGLACDPIVNPFLRALASNEDCVPRDRSEELQRFRDALGRGRRDVAQAIAERLGLQMPEAVAAPQEREFRILRDVATATFPFNPHQFGSMAWRFASRNRLGQWNEVGSLDPLTAAELDERLSSEGDDWMACSDRELLYVGELSSWSAQTREALAAMFHLKADHHRLHRLTMQEQEAGDAAPASLDGMIGDAPQMREVFATVARVARREVAISILGESGTGKELVARAIHRQSVRRSKPFTAVNCAALPENLIESELFGAVRGAFTGADRDRPGLIETSDGGTLFLDEIGEMPLLAQAKLLRFLQEGEFRRVGDVTTRTADVRVVSATNRKLDGAVEEGRFREDLYYRVSGVEIVLPPLRERTGDILALASHFLRLEREKHRAGPTGITADVESIFQTYRWPGNVRELQNTIRGAHALAVDASLIDVPHLPSRMQVVALSPAGGGSYQDAVMRFRRELIEKSLAQTEGNQNRAAALLRMSRQALAYQIRELGILVHPDRRDVTDS